MATTTKGRATDVEAILGGTKVVYGRTTGRGALQAAVREGLPYRSFENVAEALALRSGELADAIGVASRTLARRKQQRTLSAVESDRLVGIAQIATLAEATLGSRDHVRRWLRQPTAPWAASPARLPRYRAGRRQIEATLYQIRYGMIS
jgi:putative toxin-antitoxin system antitoxin component (TIGR02293 family)